jgi:hypothetical protein
MPPISEAMYDAVFGSAWHVNPTVKKVLTYVTYAGTPSGNVTPEFVGQWLLDTANSDFHIAVGLANTDWKKSGSD